MSTLAENFFLLSCTGIWKPLRWNGWKSHLYHLYSIVSIFLCFWFTLTEVLYLLFIKNNVSDFINTTFLLFTMIAVCSKMVNIVVERKAIIRVIKCLSIEPFKIKNEEEKNIQLKFKTIAR